MTKRIHITGGGGSGTTTLGGQLARALDAPHMDTDGFYWLPTDPPYTTKRAIPDRLALMKQMFLPREKWVLSGSVMGWGDPLIPAFDLVVRLDIPADIRMRGCVNAKTAPMACASKRVATWPRHRRRLWNGPRDMMIQRLQAAPA